MLWQNWIDLLNGVSIAFQSYHGDSSHYHVFPGFPSTTPGLWSVLSKDTHTRDAEDSLRLEPRTPRLRVKHPTSEPRRTSLWLKRVYPITRRQILYSSKLKEFADDNFKFDENGIKLSKRVENTVGKGEIARNEQFLLFPHCFQKACFQGASKGVIVWEWVKTVMNFIKQII